MTNKTKIAYSDELANDIVKRLREGAFIRDVTKELHCSPQTITNWRHKHPFFDKAIKEAMSKNGWKKRRQALGAQAKRKYSPDVRERILTLARTGKTAKQIAVAVDADPSALFRWMTEDPVLKQGMDEARAIAPAHLGRPRMEYDAKIAAEVLERISAGETLHAVCCSDHMPSLGVVMRWLAENEGFGEAHDHARARRAELWSDEIIAIADASESDYTTDGKGNPRLNNEAVQRSRLRVDTRKWLMAKHNPDRYGEHMQVSANVQFSLSDIVAGIHKLRKQRDLIDISPDTQSRGADVQVIENQREPEDA